MIQCHQLAISIQHIGNVNVQFEHHFHNQKHFSMGMSFFISIRFEIRLCFFSPSPLCISLSQGTSGIVAVSDKNCFKLKQTTFPICVVQLYWMKWVKYILHVEWTTLCSLNLLDRAQNIFPMNIMRKCYFPIVFCTFHFFAFHVCVWCGWVWVNERKYISI